MNILGSGMDWMSSHYFLWYKLLWGTSFCPEQIMLANQGITVYIYSKPSRNRICISRISDISDSIQPPDCFYLNRAAVIYAASIRYSFPPNQPPTLMHVAPRSVLVMEIPALFREPILSFSVQSIELFWLFQLSNTHTYTHTIPVTTPEVPEVIFDDRAQK